MLSPQDFARLLQDKLIEAGEDRPLEFKSDLFAFATHGSDLASMFPLDNYYRYYLGAANDTERKRVVADFVRDWQRHARVSVAASTVGAAGKPAVPPVVAPPPVYRPAPAGISVRTVARVFATMFAIGGLSLVCMCALPWIAGLVLMQVAPEKFDQLKRGEIPEGATVTQMVGGTGGGKQDYVDPQGRPLVGLAYLIDDRWDDQREVLGGLQPIFAEQKPLDRWHNKPLTAVAGREGYVVGGLAVDAGQYVNAVKITFVRRNGNELDWNDTYESDWLGSPRGNEPQMLGGEGHEVIGIRCQQGLVLDALGLIARPVLPHAAPGQMDRAPGQPEPVEFRLVPSEPANPFETIVEPVNPFETPANP